MKSDTQLLANNQLQLPLGWRWIKLGEVLKVNSGEFLSSSLMDSNGQYPVYGGNGINGKHSSYLFESPKLIIGRVGALCGCVHITEPKSWVTDNALIVELIDSSTDFAYLYFLLTYLNLRSYANQMGQPVISGSSIYEISAPLPPLPEQKRIAAILNEKMATVDQARDAAEAQLEAAHSLKYSYIQESLKNPTKTYSVGDCLFEVSSGVGSTWNRYPVLGATRDGLAPAKEPVGSRPERYKLAETGTVFYNPMRILIGSIALVDTDDVTGITSPDYVVIKAKEGILHYRWFYHWLRSPLGESFIKSLARGAVRERILFNRLLSGSLELPTYEFQLQAAEKIFRINPLIKAIVDNLKYINMLPSAYLRKAFSGGF